MGLPRYFVDVRHAATHDRMPSLPVLRKAASHSLKWLRENYWDPMAENNDEYRIEDDGNSDRLLDCLRQFQAQRQKELGG